MVLRLVLWFGLGFGCVGLFWFRCLWLVGLRAFVRGLFVGGIVWAVSVSGLGVLLDLLLGLCFGLVCFGLSVLFPFSNSLGCGGVFFLDPPPLPLALYMAVVLA